MQMDRILKTTLAVLVFGLLWDYVAINLVLGDYYAAQPFLDMNQNPFTMWALVGYVVQALVWVVVYDKVRGSFAPGAAGGLRYGLYAGLLINLPTWLFVSKYVKDWSYSAGWTWTLLGIAFSLVAGAVTGAVYQMGGKTSA